MARQLLTFTAIFVALLLPGADSFAPGRRLHTIGSNKLAFSPTVKAADFNSIHSKTHSSTSLQMTANPGFALAAITGAISGGLFAGGLHAIAGKLKSQSLGGKQTDDFSDQG